MAVKLSKKEYKYRYKFIYENHLGKAEQLAIDKTVQENPELSYKILYNTHNAFRLSSLSLNEVADKIAKLDEYGVLTDKAVQAFRQAAQQSAGIPICAEAI